MINASAIKGKIIPRIFDNIDQQLLTALQETLQVSHCADLCVGYFNLRGWKDLDSYIEQLAGRDRQCCRRLVDMNFILHHLNPSSTKSTASSKALRLYGRGAGLHSFDFAQDKLNYNIKYRMGRDGLSEDEE